MSETHVDHTKTVEHDSEHGTMSSYIVGFIFSLLFTFIPYYLVVNGQLKGTPLLVTILVFAVIQMIIQITFFLHIGRGPQPNWNLYFFASTVGIILVVTGGSVFIINNLHYNMAPGEQKKKLVNDEGIYQVGGLETGACQNVKANHVVTIENGAVSPYQTVAEKCDTLTFVNNDTEDRELTFGTHPDKGTYAGEKDIPAKKGRGKTITLSETGTFLFHDHVDAEVSGYFTVNP